MIYIKNKEDLETLSRYALVIILSKRARQIVDGAEAKVDTESHNPVSIAMDEYLEDKIEYDI